MEISNIYFKKNHLITGRASTAIYLALKNERIINSDVIIPGNICYAAVFPIIASGNNAVFCDVLPESGNVSLEILKEYYTSNTKALIVPHMYGNCVKDLADIKKWCSSVNCILIEDCASSQGGFCTEYGSTGTVGDYVVYSYGYSKIVDLGNGGLLVSDKDLSLAEKELSKLPFFNKKIETKETDFSREYRIARYVSYSNEKVKKLLENDLFLYQISDDEISNKIFDINIVSEFINDHINNYVMYEKHIDKSFPRYVYTEGSIPWRVSLLLNETEKKSVVKELLNNSLPVSDWYPNVTDLFLDEKLSLPGVDKMEKMIVNFPLDVEEKTILEICATINKTKR